MDDKRILIITGSSADVREDLAALPVSVYGYPCEYMAIGLDAVDRYDWPIRYVATYHPEEIPTIRRRRESVGNTDYAVIAQEAHPGVSICIRDWWKGQKTRQSGSSALLGVQAALGLGYRKMILCGCPLVGVNADKNSYSVFRFAWETHLPTIRDHVRSMSGWTRELLGAPTEEWINE